MADRTKKATLELDESRNSGGNIRFQSLRSLPKSWIIVGVIFYCASVLTVGLLAGLVPKRTQHITVIATPMPVLPNATTGAIVTATATAAATTSVTQDPSQCINDECNPRLISDLTVDSYELEYTCNDTRQTTAEGQVTIEFRLKQPTKQLIYHSKGLIKLEEPAIFEDGVYRFVSMRKYIPNDYISLSLSADSLFAPNRYKLVQKFVVNLTATSLGFYRSFYKDNNETMGTLLATKFRPTEARTAFPCFDEPHLKATFKINIIHPMNTIALSNFPIIEENDENGLRRTIFVETFALSTYLVSWAILPDTYGKKFDDNDEPMVTVWARQEPTNNNHTLLALETASNAIPFYKDYFNTADALPPKIDILAIFDLASTAMESSGLISFREDRIIYDAKIASTFQKQQFADIVAHEIAHSWMGNYVTCKWWDDIWFSEAMVSWLCRKTFAVNHADWNMELQVLTEYTIPAMWDDAKPSSHPIVVRNAASVGEILSYLDALAYSKGVSLMRMLEKITGSENFRNNIRDYLLINAYSVGDLNMFYDKLLTTTNGTEFMNTWLNEMNYPLLNVGLNVENGETKLVFTQSRFIISDALNSSNLNQNYRWKININCVLGGRYPNSDTTDIGGETINFILENEQEDRILPGKSFSWIKCNQNFQSFYVTKYSFPTSTWQRFSTVLEAQPTFFSNEDKVNLMQDTFLLAYKGLVDYIESLRIVRSLVKINTTQYVHWKTFQWHWETLADLVDYLPDTLTKFQNFAIQQILSNGVTLDNILALNLNDDDNTKLVKSLQFALLCRMNHRVAIEKATALFKSIPVEYFNNGNADINIPADFLSTVYTYHLKNDANEADWNRMFNYYKIATSTHEQTRSLVAISSTNNTNRLNQLLNDGLTGSSNTVRSQDYFTMMGYMCRHAIGRETVWTFYKDNYQNLVNHFTLENRRFATAIVSITRSFDKESYLQEMNELFARYPNAGAGQSARQQAIDQVRMNIEWIKSREQNLRNAFDTIS